MKAKGHKVELVTEFAKDLTYEKAHSTMNNQLALLGEQDRRLRRLEGQVDYAITDSPLILSTVYAQGTYDVAWFHKAALGAFESYQNKNFFITRAKPYQPYGRRESEESARSVDGKIEKLLGPYIPWSYVLGDEHAPKEIYEMIKPKEFSEHPPRVA